MMGPNDLRLSRLELEDERTQREFLDELRRLGVPISPQPKQSPEEDT